MFSCSAQIIFSVWYTKFQASGNARFTVPPLVINTSFQNLLFFNLSHNIWIRVPSGNSSFSCIYHFSFWNSTVLPYCKINVPPFYSSEQEPELHIAKNLFLTVLSQISIFMGLAVSLLLWGTAAIYDHALKKSKACPPHRCPLFCKWRK